MRNLTSEGQGTARQAGQVRARPEQGKVGKRQARAGTEAGASAEAGEGQGQL